MILVDTGVLIAEANPRDDHHERVVGWRKEHPTEEFHIPGPVVVETAHLLQAIFGPAAAGEFVGRVGRVGLVEEAEPADYRRASELMIKYSDFPIGVVDAMVVAIAERIQATTIFTTDRRHFGAIRPAHCESFELVP